MSMAIASRYAHALVEALGPAGDYRTASRELEDFVAVWRESQDLREVLLSPAVPGGRKRKILDSVLERLGASVPSSNLLRVLLANYRLSLLEEIVGAFHKTANERQGIVEVEILSAQDLSIDEQGSLRKRFEELTGKKVEMQFHRDEKLLAGVQARIGSMIYDGSAQGFLERLREQLTSV